MTTIVTNAPGMCPSNAVLISICQWPLSFLAPSDGRREWTRTIDPHHVKALRCPGELELASFLAGV